MKFFFKKDIKQYIYVSSCGFFPSCKWGSTYIGDDILPFVHNRINWLGNPQAAVFALLQTGECTNLLVLNYEKSKNRWPVPCGRTGRGISQYSLRVSRSLMFCFPFFNRFFCGSSFCIWELEKNLKWRFEVLKVLFKEFSLFWKRWAVNRKTNLMQTNSGIDIRGSSECCVACCATTITN